MPDYSLVGSAVQLGGVVRSCVDMATGEVLPVAPGVVARADVRSTRRSCPRREGGLSTAHIPTVEEPKPSAVIGWVGGSLLKVQHAGPYSLNQSGGGRRGKVKGFSRGSRRRLQRMMATVEKKNLPVFATLTYPDQFPSDLETWNVHLERLRARLTRKGWGCIWRREFQTRKSGVNVGRVAPHYHLLIWGATCKEIRSYLPGAWWEVCGRLCDAHLLAGTRVEVIRTWGGVAGYVSKYMAKEEQLPQLEDAQTIGRFWGVINRDVIPWAEAITLTCDEKTVNTFFRYLRRFAGLRGRSSWPSLSVYTNDPWKWLELANLHESQT